jgi:hypothetical protein
MKALFPRISQLSTLRFVKCTTLTRIAVTRAERARPHQTLLVVVELWISAVIKIPDEARDQRYQRELHHAQLLAS